MNGDGPTKPAAPASVVVVFEIADTGERFHVTAREGVATAFPGGHDGAQATVRLPHLAWMSLLLGVVSLGDVLLLEAVEARGDLAVFVRFHRRFATAHPARCTGLRAGGSGNDSEGGIQ